MHYMINYDLKKRAERASVLTALIGYRNGSAHMSSSLSCVEALTAAFEFKRNFPKTEIILSKGHASAAQFAAMSQTGFLQAGELINFGKEESNFGIHLSQDKNIPLSTGSLGHGLSFGVGISIANSINKFNDKTIILIGDGESNEGSIWEAASIAGRLLLNNLILLVDYNQVQAVGTYKDISGDQDLVSKFESFGWSAKKISAHDPVSIYSEIQIDEKKPRVIILDSQENPSIGFMQNSVEWHYRNPTEEEIIDMITKLDAKQFALDILELFNCEKL